MMGSRFASSPGMRRGLLQRQIAEIDATLAKEPEVAPAVVAEVQPEAVQVIIGTARMARERPELVAQLTSMVNRAYAESLRGLIGARCEGYERVDEEEVEERLQMGDAGARANRVLHIALRKGEVVGCMSSTFSVGWCEDGCGHWGLLVVDVAAQGTGVASALVFAAEQRLAGACHEIQIEYEYTPGDAHSERLLAWYEGKAGFRCTSGRSRGAGTSFRRCRKPIPEAACQAARRARLFALRAELASEIAELEAPDAPAPSAAR